MRDKLIGLINDLRVRNEVSLTDNHAKTLVDSIIADGWIRPPCKVGDTVFVIEKNCLKCSHFKDAGYSDWCECGLDDNKLMFEVDFDCDCHYEIIEAKFEYGMIDKFGKTVFLTPKEADKALAERNGKPSC